MRNAEAFNFFKGLEAAIESKLPGPDTLRKKVRETVIQAKSNIAQKHMRQPEDAFLYGFAVPILFEYLQSACELTADQARCALLSEYYRNMKDKCSDTPARRQRHPFNKAIGAKPTAIMDQWKGGAGAALRQSCPDFALRSPSPFTVVFEGKYFESGGRQKAETDLVTNLYQAFFYRSLPKIEGTARVPAWDYEYACLFVCDASVDGTLHAAWHSLDKTVKAGFWDGANLYVMILRGQN